MFIMIVYTITESEFNHNIVPNTVFFTEYYMKMKIDPLFHNPFIFKDVSPQIHHQHYCDMCYINGKRNFTSYFFGTCNLLTPNPINRVPYKQVY